MLAKQLLARLARDARGMTAVVFGVTSVMIFGIAGIVVNHDTPGKLSGRAEVRVPVTLVRVIGLDDMRIRVEAEIVASSQDVETVLMVDNKGSMAGAKLNALKH